MKTAKKCISILLLLTIIASFTVFAEEASLVQTEKSAAINENAKLCMDLGLLTEDEYAGDNTLITKGNFLNIAARLAGIDTEASAYRSIVNTYPQFTEFKNTSSDESVSFGSAARILVTIAGYEQKILSRGTQTENYFTEAQTQGITNGINAAASDKITYADAVKMVVNTFDVEYFGFSGIDGNGNSSFQTNGKTVLNALLDIYEGSGQITATSVTGLYSAAGGVGKGNIAINGVVYTTKLSCVDYIGVNVDFYYKDADDVLEVLYITPEEEQLKIMTEDLGNISLTSIEYYDDVKTRTKNISSDALLFYNGVAAPDMTKEDIENANGYVIFDTPSTRTAGVVSVWDFYSICVYLHDIDENKIIDINRSHHQIIPDNYSDYEMTDAEGNKMFMVDIKYGYILSIAEDPGKNFLRIVMSTNKIQGSVEAINGTDKITVNGTEYELSDEFLNSGSEAAQKLTLGAVGTFHVNAFGKIVDIEWSSDGYVGGYLIKAKPDDLGEKVTLKILTEAGTIEEIPCDEEVSINSQTPVSGNAIVTALQYVEDSVTKVDQMIRYRLGGGGVIKKIDTAYFKDPNSGEISDLQSGESEDSLRLMFAEAMRYYKKSQYLIGGLIPLVQDTLIFNVPEDVNNCKDVDFSVSPYTGMGGEASYMVAGYTIGDSIVSKYVVKPTSSKEVYACILKVREALNDDNEAVPYITIAGYYGSKYLKDQVYELTDKSLLDGFNLGDYVLLSVNGAEQVTGITPIYRWKSQSLVKSVDANGNDVLQTRNPTAASYTNKGRYAAGKPLKIEQNFMQIECPDPQTPSTLLLDYSAPNKFKIVIVEETARNGITTKYGTVNDIKTDENFGTDCSKIFYHTSYGDPKVMIVHP